jgi:hypothetical protein
LLDAEAMTKLIWSQGATRRRGWCLVVSQSLEYRDFLLGVHRADGDVALAELALEFLAVGRQCRVGVWGGRRRDGKR